MKFKDCFFMFLLLVPFRVLGASDVIFYDGFESNDFSLWSRADNIWNTVSNTANAHAGTRRAELKGPTGGEQVLSLSKPTANHRTISLDYWYKVAAALESSDYIFVEWSPNSSDWNFVASYSSIGAGSWTHAQSDLPASAQNDGFQFRFRGNFNGSTDVFQLDDIQLTGESLTTPTPSATPTPSPSPTPTPTPNSTTSPTLSPIPSPSSNDSGSAVTVSPSTTPNPTVTPVTTLTPTTMPFHTPTQTPPSLVTPSGTPTPSAIIETSSPAQNAMEISAPVSPSPLMTALKTSPISVQAALINPQDQNQKSIPKKKDADFNLKTVIILVVGLIAITHLRKLHK